MKCLTYPQQLLLGALSGLAIGFFTLVPEVHATDCVPQDSVELTFESSSSAADAPFWQREFTAPEDPGTYDSRSLTNVSLSSHGGWWRLKHKGDQ